MRLIVFTVLLSFASVLGSHSDEFYLKHDASGRTVGPFDAAPGSKVQIGKTTFTVVPRQAGRSGLEKKLETITIQSLEVRDAPLDMVIDVLKMQTRQGDPDKKGVNFVVIGNNRAAPSSAPLGGPDSVSGLRVTISLQEVSALEALKLITEQAKARLHNVRQYGQNRAAMRCFRTGVRLACISVLSGVRASVLAIMQLRPDGHSSTAIFRMTAKYLLPHLGFLLCVNSAYSELVYDIAFNSFNAGHIHSREGHRTFSPASRPALPQGTAHGSTMRTWNSMSSRSSTPAQVRHLAALLSSISDRPSRTQFN